MRVKGTIQIEGIEALQMELSKRTDLTPVKNIVRVDGGLLNNTMKRRAQFRGHYEWEVGKGLVFKNPTGTTMDSIHMELKDGGLTAVVGPTTEYSPYLEWGTRKMTPQPFVHPAFDEVKNIFVNDLKRLVR